MYNLYSSNIKLTPILTYRSVMFFLHVVNGTTIVLVLQYLAEPLPFILFLFVYFLQSTKDKTINVCSFFFKPKSVDQKNSI